MKTYGVTLPVTGILYVEVEAENENDAIDKAMEADVTIDDIQEWESHRQIVQGNVFHGHTNNADAEYLGGDEEE